MYDGKAAAVEVDDLTQVCYIIVHKYGAVMIQMRMNAQRFNMERVFSIRFPVWVHMYQQCRIIRPAGVFR